jgi:hypothetical protein
MHEHHDNLGPHKHFHIHIHNQHYSPDDDHLNHDTDNHDNPSQRRDSTVAR